MVIDTVIVPSSLLAVCPCRRCDGAHRAWLWRSSSPVPGSHEPIAGTRRSFSRLYIGQWHLSYLGARTILGASSPPSTMGHSRAFVLVRLDPACTRTAAPDR